MFGIILEAIIIGAGATAFLDLVSAARSFLFRATKPDYALVGRWLAYLPRGQLFHDAISRSSEVTRERLLGWTAHYLTGIAFAGVLLLLWPEWTRSPSIIPAMIVGIGSVAAPFLLMQPGMGLGIAASRAPNPNAARLRSLTTHAIFGLGLYAAGWCARAVVF
jgi:hypothetical protein